MRETLPTTSQTETKEIRERHRGQVEKNSKEDMYIKATVVNNMWFMV